MHWLTLTAIGTILLAIGPLIQRVLSKPKNSDPIVFASFYQITTGTTVAIIGLITHQLTLGNIRPVLPNFILAMLLFSFGNIFIFKALKVIEASKFTIIYSSRGLFTITASSLLLHETLSSTQAIGALLIFLAIIVIHLKSFSQFIFSKKELPALLAAVCFGLTMTNDRYLLSSLPVYFYGAVAWIFPGLIIATAYPQRIKTLPKILTRKVLLQLTLLSFTFALATIAFYQALKLTPNSSQLVSISLTSVILTVILAYIFLKERQMALQKLIAAVLSFMGLLLLT